MPTVPGKNRATWPMWAGRVRSPGRANGPSRSESWRGGHSGPRHEDRQAGEAKTALNCNRAPPSTIKSKASSRREPASGLASPRAEWRLPVASHDSFISLAPRTLFAEGDWRPATSDGEYAGFYGLDVGAPRAVNCAVALRRGDCWDAPFRVRSAKSFGGTPLVALPHGSGGSIQK